MICPICKNKKFKKLLFIHEVASWNSKKYSLFKCKKCELIRPFPLPYQNNSKLSIYNSEENIKFYDPKNKSIDFEGKEYQKYFKHFKQYSDFIDKYKIKGKHLDIGCGAGHLLYLISKKGMESEGLEISEKLVSALKKRYRVLCTEIYDKKLKENRYNLITMSHVLEHIENPDSFIKNVNSLLLKKGYVIISVPYIKGIVPRLLRAKWYGLGHGQHLNLFSQKNLKMLFEKNKFKIIELKISILDYTSPKFPRILNFFSLILSGLINFLGLGDNLYLVAIKVGG